MILSIALVMVIVWWLPASVQAMTVTSGRTVFVGHDEVVKEVYAAGGGTIDLAGSFSDDILVGGGTVTVSGPVGGDLLIGGGTVKVTGEVKGSIRVAGGTVDLDAKVGRNVMLLGGTLTIGPAADIAGETMTAGGTLVAAGHIGQSLDSWGGSVLLNGRIDGETRIRTGDDCRTEPCVTLGPNAAIGGNLTYWAAVEAKIDPAAKVSGTTTRYPGVPESEQVNKLARQFFTLVGLWNLFSLLVVATLVALLLPRTVRNVADVMLQRSGRAVGWGVLVFLAVPFALMLLLFTVIGVPLALILMALYVLSLYAAQVFLGYTVGRWVLDRMRPTVGSKLAPVWPTLLGVIVVSLLLDFGLPYLGVRVPLLAFLLGIFRLLLVLWSFGALLLVKWGYVREREQ